MKPKIIAFVIVLTLVGILAGVAFTAQAFPGHPLRTVTPTTTPTRAAAMGISHSPGTPIRFVPTSTPFPCDEPCGATLPAQFTPTPFPCDEPCGATLPVPPTATPFPPD